MKNLIAFARKRGGKSMADKLAAEILDAYNEQGGAFKRKEDMHRMAELTVLSLTSDFNLVNNFKTKLKWLNMICI